jgi:hypothetical protein
MLLTNKQKGFFMRILFIITLFIQSNMVFATEKPEASTNDLTQLPLSSAGEEEHDPCTFKSSYVFSVSTIGFSIVAATAEKPQNYIAAGAVCFSALLFLICRKLESRSQNITPAAGVV